MQQDFDAGQLKALFSQLRRSIGSQEAAATYLGISRQRVAQLESANEDHADDVPTWAQVWTLENALGRSVVFAGMARQVAPPALPRDTTLLKETHDVVQKAAAMLPLADDLRANKPGALMAFLDGIQALKQEAVECATAAAMANTEGQ